MKSIVFVMTVAAAVLLMSSTPAHATIEVIKGSLTCFIGCNKNVVQSVAQGQEHVFEVVGEFVDLSTKVEITGSGVSVSYGARRGGSNSSIIVRFNVHPDAAPGERTVKMRYTVETSGPDTFKIRVVRRGNISRIQYRRPLPPQRGQRPSSELVAPVNLPLNQRVVLVVTGTKLSNVAARPHSSFRNVSILPGSTDTQTRIEVEFSQSGQGPLFLFDSVLSQNEMNASTSSQFLYTGGANLNIQYGQAASAGARITPPPIVGGGVSAPAPFVDVAPRPIWPMYFAANNQDLPLR
jgi:hypothetical protein